MKRYCLLIFLPFSLFLISSVFGMEFKIQVITGWNLVSLPVQPSDSSITSIISGHEDDIASVWKWKQGNWAVYIPSFSSDTLDQYAKQKGFYILEDINAGEGFWINSNNGFTISVSGKYPEDPSLNLSMGWNLVGLKENKTDVDIETIFKKISDKIKSVWKWKDNTWAVFLFTQPEILDAYVNAKGFTVLSNISAGEGFWVNASEDTGPFPYVEGMVLDGSVVGRYAPVPGAEIYVEGKKMAQTDLYGKFKYYGMEDINIEVKADGYISKNFLFKVSSGTRSYFIIKKEETGVPEAAFGKNAIGIDKGDYEASDFKEYPNLFLILASPPPVPAKPTPKVISDDFSVFIITNMKLEKDITVALDTFDSLDEISLYNLAPFFSEGSDTLILGGANVPISDSEGNPISSDDAGFSAKIRVINKKFLNENKISLSEIYNKVQAGTGRIYLFYLKGEEWILAGDGQIVSEDGGSSYYFKSEDGVYLTGLYPFIFVYSSEKTIKGRLLDQGGNPISDAFITCGSTYNTSVSAEDGSFSINVPESVSSLLLRIIHEDHYIKELQVEIGESEVIKDVGDIKLAQINKKEIKGNITNQKGNPLSGIKLILNIKAKPSTILLPEDIDAVSDSDGNFSFGMIPEDILSGASIDIVMENGYDPDLQIKITETEQDTIEVNIQVAIPLWTYQTDGNIYATPTIKDGRVYIGSCDGKFYCLDAQSGSLVYTYNLGVGVFSRPLIDESHIYLTTLKNRLYILNAADGTPAIENGFIEVNPFASEPPNIISSPVMVDSKIVFGSTDKLLYSYNQDGTPYWSEAKNSVITSDIVFENGKLYFGSWDGYLYCHGSTLEDHAQKWKYPKDSPLPARILSTPLIMDGKVYFGGGNNIKAVAKHKESGEELTYKFNTEELSSKVVYSEEVNITITKELEDKHIYCLNAETGEEIWKFEIGGSVVGRPSISGDRLVVGALDGYIYCLDISDPQDVKLEWKFKTEGEIYSSPLIIDDKIYIGSNDSMLYCIDLSSGQMLYSFKAKRGIISSPVYYDGKIFFGSLDGAIYCIEID